MFNCFICNIILIIFLQPPPPPRRIFFFLTAHSVMFAAPPASRRYGVRYYVYRLVATRNRRRHLWCLVLGKVSSKVYTTFYYLRLLLAYCKVFVVRQIYWSIITPPKQHIILNWALISCSCNFFQVPHKRFHREISAQYAYCNVFSCV